ncbi:MAG: M24 family metallopeptidase [Calditrichia bacterium]
MIREKIEQAGTILKELDIDCWLIFLRETLVTPDPIQSYVVGADVTWESAFILTASGQSIAIVGSLDAGELQEQRNFGQIITYVEGIRQTLLETLLQINPNKIAVNYSESIPAADGLTHGMRLKLEEYLKETDLAKRIVSAEPVITRLRGRKTVSEKQAMQQAIAETLDIFAVAANAIQPGKTELDIAKIVQQEMDDAGLEPAWSRAMCPAVFTGPDTAIAHAAPTERIIEAGHIINMDFGVKINGYCADLQRSWYVRHADEKTAPDAVQHGFDTLIAAITLGAEHMRTGAIGKDIDTVVREYLIANGYEGYPHGLGHQLGRVAHDGGALVAPAWERYGNTPFIPLEAGQIFTIEPRLTVKGHGVVTIEEEVLITDSGAEFLSPRQHKIWLR